MRWKSKNGVVYCVITVDLLRKIEDLSDVTKNAKKGERAKVSDNKNDQEKRRFTLWVKNSTMDEVEKFMDDAGCKKTSEFIEKAILFYTGYLSAEDNRAYLPSVIVSTMKGIVAESENKQGRALFKLAVEMAIMMNLIAAKSDVDELMLERLRGACVAEVKRLNGNFTFEDALNWQKG